MAVTLDRNLNSLPRPAGMNYIGLAQTGAAAEQRVREAISAGLVAVSPGVRYCLAGYIATIGCTARLRIRWFNAAGELMPDTGDATAPVATDTGGGADLANWPRVHVFALAPSGAAWLQYRLAQTPVAGATSCTVCLLRPTVEEALPGQTEPSLWAESAAGTRAAIRESQDYLASELAATASRVTELSASSAAADARIKAEEEVRAERDRALSRSVQQVGARLESGGDVNSAIVQVTTLAEATAAGASGSWGVLIDANGKMTGIKLFNDGTTGKLLISADETIIDGTVLARHLSAETINAVSVLAAQGVFDELSGRSLSFISADLGSINAGQVSFNAAGWGWLRSNTKWWADGAAGWVLARHDNGTTFADFVAGACRIRMHSSGEAGISFPNFSVDNAGNVVAKGDIEATKFLARSATTGERTEHTEKGFYVYAANNVLIVEVGEFRS
ncbi:MAG: hypothetical protein REI09_05185 [Candidatus Dactylopiibacterium sp.]|nr:hypothetical protein [Candidatus Dactylopiibacterium sp.]